MLDETEESSIGLAVVGYSSGTSEMIAAWDPNVPSASAYATTDKYRYLLGNGERHTNTAIRSCVETISTEDAWDI